VGVDAQGPGPRVGDIEVERERPVALDAGVDDVADDRDAVRDKGFGHALTVAGDL
jgi:hypothetical protein